MITSPLNHAAYSFGESFTISVEANDPDGLVSEIKLYLDGDNLASLSTSPFNHELNTEEYTPGSYNIKATAFDNEGLGKSYEIGITINALIPAVTTGEISENTDSSAICGGEVASDGGDSVTSRGVCWNTSPNPTTAEGIALNGRGTGSFTSSISGLSCGTTYFVRAFATNSTGTAYGSQVRFTTSECPVFLSTITTTSINNITKTTAQCGGNVTDGGGGTVGARGVCWSTSQSPTTADSHATAGTGLGTFTSSITGLDCNTTYYVRAYAFNSVGKAYGSQVEFTTSECPIYLPTVTTASISNITESTAQCGGNVTDDGGATVSARGVCWSTSQSPTTADSHTIDGSATGSFINSISGLSCGTTYFVRAFATNSKGTAFGSQVSFSTTQCIFSPFVSTVAANVISETGATIGGDVLDDGGGTVLERGIYYGTGSDPVSTGSKIQIGSGTGGYTYNLTNLTSGTIYYFVAYAINNTGPSFGSTLNFTTNELTVTDYDGNVYNTVKIGNQTWMAENLNVTHFPNGTLIPLVEDDVAWVALLLNSPAYCWYNKNPSIGDTYGALYTWTAAMNGAASSDTNPSDVQGVCPSGWHVPSDEEWKLLEYNIGMNYIDADASGYRGTDEGGKLKETGTYYWDSPNTGATNSSGFTARPGGMRTNMDFYGLGNIAIFWTASKSHPSAAAWVRLLLNQRADINRRRNVENFGLSVRCVKD